jgi:hypothetical protein
MERSTIIDTVVAAGGILIAGSVASTAVINAAVSTKPQTSDTQILAAAATPVLLSATTAAQLPALTVEPLPGIVVPAAGESAAQTTQAAPTPGKSTAKDAPASTQNTEGISVDKAVGIVLGATDGGILQYTRQESHRGYDTWAVTVKRTDGSVVTGYVDRATGSAFDWVVVKEAPAAVGYSDDEEYSESEHDKHESEGKDHDQHEEDGDDD